MTLLSDTSVSSASKAQAGSTAAEHHAHTIHLQAADAFGWQPQSPAPGESLRMFLCLCFILIVSKASVRVWLSLMSVIQANQQSLQHLMRNYSDLCAVIVLPWRRGGLWSPSSDMERIPTGGSRAAAAAHILCQGNHLAKKYMRAWNLLHWIKWAVRIEGGTNKTLPSELSYKVLIPSRGCDFIFFLICTQPREFIILKWLGEARQSLLIDHNEVNES